MINGYDVINCLKDMERAPVKPHLFFQLVRIFCNKHHHQHNHHPIRILISISISKNTVLLLGSTTWEAGPTIPLPGVADSCWKITFLIC